LVDEFELRATFGTDQVIQAEEADVSLSAAPDVRLISYDSAHPRAERPFAFVLSEPLYSFPERILYHLLRVVAIAQNTERYA
jgi:hypothetical protein